MRFSTIQSGFLTSTLFFAASLPAVVASGTYKGCYSDVTPLGDEETFTYQSTGHCEQRCSEKNKAVYALYQGSTCYCGDEIPASDNKVSDDKCSTSCDGYSKDKCGGDSSYGVYLSGDSDNVQTYGSSSTTTGSSQTTSTVETSGGNTVVVTAASQNDSTDEEKDSGPNTAAIAAGVVVGVVGFCALVGAGFFLWRFRKRKSIEEEYRRNAAIDQYGKPKSASTMSDSRFDGDFLAQRRQSNGSIDDDQDFSRRILQVTNPDRS